MEREQELEWAKAQKIVISEDLVAAAKQQLRFLAEVDRHRCLYAGPVLDRAIHRYKNCWLPLLAKHTKSQVTEDPLVVPLDCEWIWHCHRLNPVRYKADCEKYFGKVLDTQNVVSSVKGSCKKQTEEVWNRMYSNEPYELNMSTHFSENIADNSSGSIETTNYDLVSAVKRQSSFFFQVSAPHMNDRVFLEGALARYKGFLYLIKSNRERSIRRFCVPTYDIDLMWHCHQLLPVSYCKDLVTLVGKVLQHDDTDSDRRKGKKLDVGFSETTKQWEETFGSRYWRAGAMHRGIVPSPLTTNVDQLDILNRKVVSSNDYENMIQLPKKMLIEAMVEIVAVKNLPAEHEGSVFVTFGKKQPDTLFNNKRKISILSETEEKGVAVFQCEPTGEFVFELMSYSSSALSTERPPKSLGSTSISLQDLVNPISELLTDKWYELVKNSGVMGEKPIKLRIALSFTPPVPAPYVLHLVQRRPFSNSPFPLGRRFHHDKGWTSVLDEIGNEVINIQMRDSIYAETKNNCLGKKEVIGLTSSGETCVLAEFSGTEWSLINSNWLFQLLKKFNDNEDKFELTGSRKVIIFRGRKLEYDLKNCEIQKVDQNFMTAVEFSEENPYGKAVALLNLESCSLKINEKWLLLLGILLAFLLSSDTSLSKEGAKKGHKVNPEIDCISGRECDDNYGSCVDCAACGDIDHRIDGFSAGICRMTRDTPTDKNAAVEEGLGARRCLDNYVHELVMKSGCYGPCRGECGGCGGCGMDMELVLPAANEAVASQEYTK